MRFGSFTLPSFNIEKISHRLFYKMRYEAENNFGIEFKYETDFLLE